MRLWTIVAALAVTSLLCFAAEAGPPPVMEDLGRVNPTPVPAEKAYDRKRLITSLTVQNSPEGETIVTFEATDVAKKADGTFRNIASRRYSLSEVKQKHLGLRDAAFKDLRELESALLRFVDAVGGPREAETGTGGERPQ